MKFEIGSTTRIEIKYIDNGFIVETHVAIEDKDCTGGIGERGDGIEKFCISKEDVIEIIEELL